ncbi:glycosyl transferase family protein [Thalassospira xiamenensis]|uniref:Anthranilate phosphoribosyltransferase n=1 Tax=Thalassospira xiamenensis TaxID=220697 RepID=A0A285RBV5_9PROT|nr:glycosyl transferase family protein [Thalassospira xiamenensis]SOB91576.1 Anthranilate phosphoribosyltransferase [Thalassospira xiamenensis]
MTDDHLEQLEDDNHLPESHPFSGYLRTFFRGPGRSRSLTREEAFDAFSMILRDEVEPIQLGAFLLMLRYRAETPDELAGMIEAVRKAARLELDDESLVPEKCHPMLDWPSYAAGRSRGLPWFVLSAMLLSRNGIPVLMHGYNSHLTNGVGTEAAVKALKLPLAMSADEARSDIASKGFAYLPLRHIHPKLQELIGLRPLLGLRSPVNTLLRLLNPLQARAAFLGVFHPAFLDVHRETGKLLELPRIGVIKGGGGEAERTPFKHVDLRMLDNGELSDVRWPALLARTEKDDEDNSPVTLQHFLAVWRGEVEDSSAIARIKGSAAMGAFLAGKADYMDEAEALVEGWWEKRDRKIG